ncbi:MAG: hypothetical protein ACK4E0_07030 [Chitinophagaceae bacterium]
MNKPAIVNSQQCINFRHKKRVSFFVAWVLSMFFCIAPNKSEAQTTLSAGDIAFVAYNGDGTIDDFAFMLLKDISASTTITFTDHLWRFSTGGFNEVVTEGACNTEAFLTWTATTALTTGTVVVIASPGASGSSYPSQATASTGTVSVPGGCPDFTFPPSGDVLFAYQGTKPANNSATNWLACINMDGGWLAGASTSTSASAQPTNLSNDHIILFSPEVDNVVYKGTLTGSAAQLRTAIYNLANWDTDDTTPFILPQDIGSSTLPVSWGTFNALPVEAGVELRWTTLSESGTAHFEVEYASDGRHFIKVDQLPAAGNAEAERTYMVLVPSRKLDANSNKHFFRIRQVDLDARFSYSLTRIVLAGKQPALCHSISTNVAGREMLLQLQKPGLLVQLYDLQGRKLAEQKMSTSSARLSVHAPSASVLIVHITDENGRRETHKVNWN